MTNPLRLLLVEDSEDDAAIVLHVLEQAGYEVMFERVHTAAAMSAALHHTEWDLVLSDHNMPRFSAPAALRLLRGWSADLPFFIISSNIH